jgi:uncharacterized protein (DUF58 family)
VLSGDRWQPTTSLVRAGLAFSAFAVTAVVTGRADLLVLAAPLLVHAVAAVVRRPRTVPTSRSRLGTAFVREGDGTTLHADISRSDGVEHGVLALTPHRWLAADPASGVVAATVGEDAGDAVHLRLGLGSLRWGRRRVGDALVAATSPWAGYRWGPMPIDPHVVTTLPQPGAFDSRTASPHPIGLVGTHPARRRGEGSEFESIRPFQPGDKLRRVQWRVSLRTGELHVTSTVAEEDASVLLLVDSGIEVGASGGVHGRASTLDVAVRAAGAVAEHYLVRGDRVGLRVLGSTGRNVLPTAAGRRHLRRVLDTLAGVVPGENRELDLARMRFRVPAGTIVLVFSPMLSQAALVATTTLASRGLDVVVVDCLPEDLDLGRDDARTALAWRMRLLEREALLGRVQRAGIPVVAWRGRGTLDEVLRRLSRRSTAPSVVRR